VIPDPLSPATLIAHRGDQAHHPENTLESIGAALQAGAIHIETDVQLSRDQTPFLFHDRDMRRLTGQPGKIHRLADEQLRQRKIRNNYSIPELAAAVRRLENDPHAILFIEAKRIAIDHFGVETVFQRIAESVGDLGRRCPLISFSASFVEYAAARNWPETGLIVDSRTPEQTAVPGGINYLFSSIRALPRWNKRKPANTILAAYETSDPGLAKTLLGEGVDLVETDRFSRLVRA